MPLTTANVKSKLSAAPANQKDNVAQDLINAATPAELATLDGEGVLRLYVALRGITSMWNWNSRRDAAALALLKTHTKYQTITNSLVFAIQLIKSAKPALANVQSGLTPDLVRRLYAAEDKRMSFVEGGTLEGDIAWATGKRTMTLGRGQLSQESFEDVIQPKHYKSAWEACLMHVHLSKLLHEFGPVAPFDLSTYRVRQPTHFSSVIRTAALEDFVVAAYLAIRIAGAATAGRSHKDTLRFAVAVYHSTRGFLYPRQKAVGDLINWTPVETQLKTENHNDFVDYVNEVVK